MLRGAIGYNPAAVAITGGSISGITSASWGVAGSTYGGTYMLLHRYETPSDRAPFGIFVSEPEANGVRNSILSYGFNVGGNINNGPLIAGAGQASMGIESHFDDGLGHVGMEWHFNFTGSTSGSLRPMYLYAEKADLSTVVWEWRVSNSNGYWLLQTAAGTKLLQISSDGSTTIAPAISTAADGILYSSNTGQLKQNAAITVNSSGDMQFTRSGGAALVFTDDPRFNLSASTKTFRFSFDGGSTFPVKLVSSGILVPPTTPASASATGTTGTITADADYVYVCTATNTWKRAAIATW